MTIFIFELEIEAQRLRVDRTNTRPAENNSFR